MQHFRCDVLFLLSWLWGKWWPGLPTDSLKMCHQYCLMVISKSALEGQVHSRLLPSTNRHQQIDTESVCPRLLPKHKPLVPASDPSSVWGAAGGRRRGGVGEEDLLLQRTTGSWLGAGQSGHSIHLASVLPQRLQARPVALSSEICLGDLPGGPHSECRKPGFHPWLRN